MLMRESSEGGRKSVERVVVHKKNSREIHALEKRYRNARCYKGESFDIDRNPAPTRIFKKVERAFHEGERKLQLGGGSVSCQNSQLSWRKSSRNPGEIKDSGHESQRLAGRSPTCHRRMASIPEGGTGRKRGV